MKKTMTRILLLAAALVLALSLCLVAHAEEEEAATVSTPAFIFWQDADWWPAVSNNTDDYWTPTPAMVTGEGYYTVSVTAHMPSWFYSGGNHNRGAQKLAVIVTDGATLFPDMYMQIVDVRIDGVSYPCGDVTYGQTGYESAAEDGTLFWDADDAYALLYDQWMIDNAGTIGTGNTWNSSATAQKFDVFDVSVLDDPATIEIDFFLSAQQDVKPEGGPALRVKGEGPEVAGQNVKLTDLAVTPENATTAKLYYSADGYWPSTDGLWGVSEEVTIKGEGTYTVKGNFVNAEGWGVPSGNGAEKLLLVIADGKNGEGTVVDGMYVGVSDVRVNGVSINVGNAAYGPTGWDNGDVFDSNDGYSMIYDKWQMAPSTDPSGGGDGLLPWGHETWDGSEGTPAAINPEDLKNVTSIEIDFFVTDTQGKLPEPPVLAYEYQWYHDNTMGVAGYSLRDLGIGNKWYNVVPVNLTEDGIYKIPMVASNMYIIGNAIVTVDGDNVTVTYETQHASAGNLVVKNECVKWFSSIEEITAEFVDAPQSDIAFGDVVSKAELGDVAYLFICNGVTYSQPVTNNGNYLARYLPDAKVWVNYRAGLDAMVEAASAEEAAPVAE